ncbi:MAG TPA: L-histidine N(alpha)-methyltransferase [Segetibacter sp.]
MNSILQRQRTASKVAIDERFLNDVINGLSSEEKYLQSKYFYDEIGDKLFQKIMACPEYYLTKCEMEIFTQQKNKIASIFIKNLTVFDVVELGAGDASKSIHLLSELQKTWINFTYYPIDISKNVIRYLQQQLPQEVPSLNIKGMNGEYFNMLEKVNALSSRSKVVLFLGSNIGNVPLQEAIEFCSSLRSHLNVGDLLLIGFDLKKDPQVILDAYNDKAGYTRDFNLNLLLRINNELGADFVLENFKHQPTYDDATGACKSYLISTKDQEVVIDQQVFYFEEGERIYMEISQKYSVEQTDELATNTGFLPVEHLYDSRKWFVDAVWQCI